MPTVSFSIAASSFDVTLLPETVRELGTPEFRQAVNEFLAAEFKDFGGHVAIRVDQNISVVWDAESARPNPMAAIIEKLQQGKQAEGIQLLELIVTSRPKDAIVLYNLGLALSDAGRLERAEQCLRRAAEINGSDVNIRVALGVALGRMGRIDEAVDVLNAAVAQDGSNPWAHRNLGALLVQRERIADAIPHYETATRLMPGDQIAWQGLADAYRLAGRTKEAEEAYVRAVQIDPHSDIAEKARAGSNLLAESGFEQARQAMPREDAVQYCLAALKRFAKMSPGDLQKLALELAMAGRDGFAVHDPNRRYRCKGLDGDFSGMAMVCYLYVAMQRMAPGADIGFDLASEYAQAKKLFERNA